jgi:hypothetical protein
MKKQSPRERAKRVEDRLKRFRSLRLDPAEVKASREYHLKHWLSVAEDAIRADHRELFYRGLTANVENAVANYPEDRLPPALQRAVLRDLAFMEGHLEAFRDILRLIERLRADQS